MRNWWLALSALFGCACTSGSYHAREPQWQAVSGGRVRVLSTTRREPADDELGVELELAPGTHLLRAGVGADLGARARSRRPDAACVDQLAAQQIVDGEPRYRPEPVELGGRHRLELNLGAEPRRVLQLETERYGARYCDRVRLDWPDAWERDPFWYVELQLSYTGFGAERGVGGLDLLVARWVDQLRLAGMIGLTNAVVCTEEAACELFALPAALELKRFWSLHTSDQSLFSGMHFGAGGRLLGILAERSSSSGLHFEAAAAQAGVSLLVGSAPPGDRHGAPGGATLGVAGHAGPGLTNGAGLRAALAWELGISVGWAQ